MRQTYRKYECCADVAPIEPQANHDKTLGIKQPLAFGPFEVKTYRLQAGSMMQVNMIEESI